MTKGSLVKKITNILLAIMFCVSLLLFSACSAGTDEDNKPVLKIVYRPYATSRPIASGDTYIDLVYKNILALSKNILTEVVGQYGMGRIDVGSFDYRSPSTNGRNYKKMFGVNEASILSLEELLLPEEEKTALINQRIGEDMGRMTHVNYTHEFLTLEAKALVLSYGSSPSIADILTQILFPLDGETPLAALGSVGETNIYKIDTGSTTYYVFLGGDCLLMDGESLYSYVPTGEPDAFNFDNTKTFLKNVLGSNYGVIEKDYIGGEILKNGETVLLNFQRWNYSVAEGILENIPFNAGAYLNAYIEKFGPTFAVEIAKAMLVGGEELPVEVNCPKDLIDGDKKIANAGGVVNLKDLYDRAKSGSDEDKQSFIWAASAFVDHLGLTIDDLSFIGDQLESVIIGEEIYNSTDGKEAFTTSKNNYEKYLLLPKGQIEEDGGEVPVSALQKALDENPTKPILEWLSFDNSSYVEKIEIDGYLQSIILMSEGEIRLDTFFAEVKLEDDAIIDYALKTRSSIRDGEEIVENFFPTVNDDLSGSNILELSDFQEYFGVETISNKVDPLVGNKNSLFVLGEINVDFYKVFKTDAQKFSLEDGLNYRGWYFNVKTNFVELIFATKNVFSLTEVYFERCSFNYS